MKLNKNIMLLYVLIITFSILFYTVLSNINKDMNKKMVNIDKKYTDKIIKLQDNIKEMNKSFELLSSKVSSKPTNTNNKKPNNDINSLYNQRDALIKNSINNGINKNIDNNINNNINNENVTDTSNTNSENVVDTSNLSFPKKISLCNNLSVKKEQVSCKNDLFYARALEKMDTNFCTQIKDNIHDSEVCVKKISILKLRNGIN